MVNATEAFLENSNLDYLVPALLEAEGYRYTGAPPLALLVTRNKAMSKKILAFHGVKVPNFKSYRVGETPSSEDSLRYPADRQAAAGRCLRGHRAGLDRTRRLRRSIERVAFVHERFAQPAIAEEYIEGRELYATMIGNGDKAEILPIVEMVFEDSGPRPEDRIATQSAKWDMGYRKRRGIKNVFARRLSKDARERLVETCNTSVPGAVAARLRADRRPADQGERGLVHRGQRQPVPQLRPRLRGGRPQVGPQVRGVHPADRRRGDGTRALIARSVT